MFDNQLTINKDKIKAVIFDFDGVILDSVDVKTDAFRKLFEDCSQNIQDKIVEHHKKNGGMSRFDKIKYYFNEYIKEELNDEKFQEYLERFQSIVLEKILKCNFINGSIEFLEKNKSQLQFFIVSATPEDELNFIIQKRELAKYFIKVYGSPTSKSNNIIKVINEYSLKPNEIIYIGDSLNDFEACIKSNVLFVGLS